MSAEINLDVLIQNMNPKLNLGKYVFVSVPNDFNISKHEIVGSFSESEGLTLILKKEIADKYLLIYEFIAGWITLNIHSDLNAIGLTAAVSKTLSEHNISCNIIAGFYHDHIFVAFDEKERALSVLKNLSRQNI